ncbi:PP2C family protein-serine/threonine phosphatase [Nocardioides sp. cx-173]|uniref:PP2C family protein-serine/threonine phosphatase n=1 Tax=Nocardioides sp. cx-173 TaxID=2898796 RepID=UPI001E44E43A|nr:GAF domain-containing SpoIIE family protein phosphatase [Nocardioides sp. cx-173]MCD4527278.1 SpoIIE family protein phosphatase [Nocardioides sp. cx-173]UGB40345.1 SpoIIE family protein phosphatase [Nocardioides sp. cx-173]
MIADVGSVQGMLDSVRVVMGSDTATLLLLDETGTVLEPAASSGLGRRWRGATHVPVGSGFAGRVAAERSPVMLDEINEVSVLNPILRDFGVQALLGVPVVGTAGLLGVLHVGCLMRRTFTAQDVERLEGAAAEIAWRLSERAEDDAHLAALALQRSLLPAAPPAIDGLDLAVRYLPAEGDLGGDWYDIFTLPSGMVGLVMGDVEGHGLRSAIAMGRLRSALRAYALDYEDPEEVLHRLDRKLCYFESDICATVVYAVSEPPFDVVTVCRAGHPAPLVARSSQPFAEVVGLSAGLLLGVDAEHRRQSETIALAPGDALAFYTDGLVERRGGPAAHLDHSVDRLELVRRAFRAGDNAETACSRIIAEGLGDDSVEDDVALLVVRRPPEQSA